MPQGLWKASYAPFCRWQEVKNDGGMLAPVLIGSIVTTSLVGYNPLHTAGRCYQDRYQKL